MRGGNHLKSGKENVDMALLDRLVSLSPALVLLGLCARRREVEALLDGLRLQERSLLHPALQLSEKGRALQSNQDGSIRETFADAFGAEECPAGVESREPVHAGWH